jgi:hypothetical protein
MCRFANTRRPTFSVRRGAAVSASGSARDLIHACEQGVNETDMSPTAEMLLPTETEKDIAERTCARCEMTTTWIPRSKREKVPANWITKNGQGYCLACRRELAVDEALAKMGEGEAPAARAKVRSQAVVEFEIRRDPDRRDGDIARAARCSVMAVSKARKRLGIKRAA